MDKVEDTAVHIRKLATVVNRSMGGKDNMQECWPLHIDPPMEIMTPWTEEELKAMTEKAQVLFKQQKK